MLLILPYVVSSSSFGFPNLIKPVVEFIRASTTFPCARVIGLKVKVIIFKKKKEKKKMMPAMARNWAAGDVVEARRDGGGGSGGTKNWSPWQLAAVWGPAARGGYYWLRFLESSEVVCVPASRIRLPELHCACRIRDVELEAILMHVGGERNDAARRREEDDDDDDDDARSVSSSVGSNGGSSSEPESDCSIYSSDGSKQRAETAYCLRRAAYMSGMIKMSG